MLYRRLTSSALLLSTALAAPFLVNGCGAEDALCCTEFKAGATISGSIGGSAQAQVAVQAVADFAGIANASIIDLATACQSMSEDLDAPKDKRDAIETEAKAASADDAPKIRMQKYCQLAIDTIASVKATAGITIKIDVQPPKCEISASAKANCQAKCDVSGKCDIKANPPKCTGGKLEVSCEGSCKAEVEGGSVSCEGSCDAACEGSCTAQGGVQCSGKCEGTCEGSGGAGTSGVDAQGNCQGTCKGTCSATAPGVTCQGGCKGSCKGTCKASAPTAKVKCDGKCEGNFEPLKCEGGKLEGGCQVDAKCDANCDASIQAKAECTPPAIRIDIQGAASGDAAIEAVTKLKATFEANMGVVFAFKSRLEGMASLVGTISGNAGAVADIKAVCIPQVIAAGVKAVGDVQASAEVTGKLVTSATN